MLAEIEKIKIGDITDFTNLMGAVIDAVSYTHLPLDGSLYDRSGDWRGGAYGRAQGRIKSPAGSGDAGAGSGCYIHCQ